MFDPEAFLSDPAIAREELSRAIERIRDDALMLGTEHAVVALINIQSELGTVTRLLKEKSVL